MNHWDLGSSVMLNPSMVSDPRPFRFGEMYTVYGVQVYGETHTGYGICRPDSDVMGSNLIYFPPKCFIGYDTGPKKKRNLPKDPL